MRTKMLAMFVVIVLSVSASWAAEGGFPLPDDLNIIPPPANIPPDVKEFFGNSGKWSGKAFITGKSFPDEMPVMIIMEEFLSMKEVRVISCNGGSANYKVPRDCYRATASIAIGKKTILSFLTPNISFSKASFWIEKGVLKGERSTINAWGTFTTKYKLDPEP